MNLSVLDLPCADAGDKKLSIESAILRAADCAGLSEASPLARFASLRFQLALVRRALRGPATLEEWKARWRAGRFEKKAVGEYIEEWKDRFQLFDPKHPFMQEAALRGEEEKPAAYLASNLPADTNIAHFMHAYDASAGLGPAALAKGLLGLPVFATAGGRGIPAGINDAPPVYFFPLGPDHFQTLMLNLPIAPALEKDAPVWEGKRTSSGPIGFCEGLTWNPRRVLLGSLDEGVCALSGESAPGVVRRMVYQAGRSRSQERERPWLDPHVRVQTVKKPLPLRPPNPQASPDRFESFWRAQVMAILDAFEPDAETPPALCQLAGLLRDGVIKMTTVRIEVVALHSDGKAKLFCATNKLWTFPTPLLLEKEKRDAARALLSKLESRVNDNGRDHPGLAWKAAHHIHAREMERGAKAEKQKRLEDPLKAARAEAVPQIEAAAERVFLAWLENPRAPGEWVETELAGEANVETGTQKGGGDHRSRDDERDAQCEFVRAVANLTEADKWRFRGMLGRNPCSDVHAGHVFTEIFWPVRQKFKAHLDRESCWLVATLFAFNELPGGGRSGLDIGAAMARIRAWGYRGEHERKRAERRFQEMLRMERGQLALPLAELVRFLRKRAVAVDWERLLADLTAWNDAGQPVQRRWARQAGA
ncbi:MAG TPA: type I-E CRISPR-associated protein Cse1/CasA [Planctomycetota bacterium]|jgi:CRISPR type I-E-associated protein CasB/Cse2